jgi:predicted DNA-binding protein
LYYRQRLQPFFRRAKDKNRLSGYSCWPCRIAALLCHPLIVHADPDAGAVIQSTAKSVAPDSWCMMRCMKRTNIYLEERQTERLDRLASEEGVSRAELIRRLLDRALVERDDDLAGDLEAIENSFAVLEHVDALPRGTGDREEHLARVWRQTS